MRIDSLFKSIGLGNERAYYRWPIIYLNIIIKYPDTFWLASKSATLNLIISFLLPSNPFPPIISNSESYTTIELSPSNENGNSMFKISHSNVYSL